LSRRSRSEGSGQQSGGRVLVFGESENDSRAIKELIEGLCPSLIGRVKVRKRPLVLIKGAREENVKPQAQQIAKVVAAEDQVEAVRCLFAHRDCDDVEPNHEVVASAIEQAISGRLRAEGVRHCGVHAVVPAWETEAWWLLWPQVTAALVETWRAPTEYRGRHVGTLSNAKEALSRSLLPKGQGTKGDSRVRRYRETDSPSIARAIRIAGCADRPEGRSDS
jgi:hypothetical protein